MNQFTQTDFVFAAGVLGWFLYCGLKAVANAIKTMRINIDVTEIRVTHRQATAEKAGDLFKGAL